MLLKITTRQVQDIMAIHEKRIATSALHHAPELVYQYVGALSNMVQMGIINEHAKDVALQRVYHPLSQRIEKCFSQAAITTGVAS